MLLAEMTITLGVAVWQLAGLSVGGAARPEVAVGSSAYFFSLAATVGALAVFAWRGARWVYGPAVFLQVLALPVAASMSVEGFWLGTVLLGGLAILGLVLLLPDAGRAAFGRQTS